MAEQQQSPTVRIVCTDCFFSKLVTRDGERAAEVILEHGRETGHKLTPEDENASN